MPGALCVPVTDGIALNPALVPSLDLFQDCLNVVPHRFVAFAGVVNFYGSHGHRVGKVGLALQGVEVVRGVKWHGQEQS